VLDLYAGGMSVRDIAEHLRRLYGTPVRPRLTRAAEELSPERFGLGFADVDREDLAPAGLVNSVGDHQRLGGNAAASRTFSILASTNR
jgi:hypothetical protein